MLTIQGGPRNKFKHYLSIKMNYTINETLKNRQTTIDGDHWGNCMQWLFAICDYLTFETDECIPDEWQFNASPMGANEVLYYQS